MSQTRFKQWKDRTKKERVEYALTRYTGAIQRQSAKIKEQTKHNKILRIALWCAIGLMICMGVTWYLTLK